MSLQINRNFAAMSAGALQSLHSNQTTMGKAISHVSTGKRVNTAADDIGAYLSGRRFQSDAEGYKALHTGVQNGAAQLHAVETAFDSFSNTLQNMRTLAIQYQNESDSTIQAKYKTEFNALKQSILTTASAGIGTHTTWLDGSGNVDFIIGLDSSTGVDRSSYAMNYIIKDGNISSTSLDNAGGVDDLESKTSLYDSNTKTGSLKYNNELYQLTGGKVMYGSENVGTYEVGKPDNADNSELTIHWASTGGSDTKFNVTWTGISGISTKVKDLEISGTSILSDVSACITALGKEQANVGGALNALEYISEHLSSMASMEETAYTSLTEADMAAEMTSYVKSNIYAQASQAMIAQANQSLAQVLNLLE